MSTVLRALHLRPGEGVRVAWVGAIAVMFAAATAMGEDIAQTVFITRVGAGSMTVVFLVKAMLDIVAAGLYLPLTRGRDTGRVWRVALAIYAVTMVAGRVFVVDGSNLSAYALYVGHETAGTILTIHWAVFLLDAFDASQARRLFPLLFAASRVGGIVAGLLLTALAGVAGTTNLLFGAAAFAVLAGLVSYGRRKSTHAPYRPTITDAPDLAEPGDEVDLPEDATTETGTGMLGSWRRAASSPLVRIIAISTAAMVFVRYGLQIVALDEVDRAFGSDKVEVARFLGLFGACANAVGILLGVFIVPKVLSRLGVGIANLTYAAATVASWTVLLVVPSLGAAAGARFVRVQFKDSLKTPLSTLFYGAELPHRRAGARAFIFGAAIPLGTVITVAVLELAKRSNDYLTIAGVTGVAMAIAFFIACAIQNRRWRRKLVELLEWKLSRTPAPTTARLDLVTDQLARFGGDPAIEVRLEIIARGLASTEPRVCAVAEEVLAETISRSRAHDIAHELRETLAQDESA